MDLQELLAREQIRDALARYARGVDRLDLDMALSAFHPGAVDHHGATVGDPETTFPVIFARLRKHHAGSHLLGSSTITMLGPDAAAVETSALGFHRITGAAGELQDLLIGIRYVDRFERRERTWKIALRHVIEDWRRADPVAEGVPAGTFEAGVRGALDRSYLMGV